MGSKKQKTADAEKLAQALAGRQSSRKLTPAIVEYVRIRFPSIYADDRYTYSSKIRQELKKVFKVELSSEALRPLLAELKSQQNASVEVELDEPPASDEDDDDDQMPGQGSESGEANQAQGEKQSAPSLDSPLEKSRSVDHNRNKYADLSKASWCSHLGLLLFGQPLISLQQALGEQNGPPVCQWASQVLLGAQNLEQTKLQSRGSPGHQRRKLAELACGDPGLAENILRWNFQRVGGDQFSDFYFDPHTKHYTGKQNVLKGWCAKIRWADKIMNGDYVHSTNGQPLYLENTDNYEDIRQRFKQLEGNFRECLGIEKKRELTWIVDRGIFSHEFLEWFEQSPNKHLITWEKDYQRDGWPEGKAAAGSMEIERLRNDSSDRRTYHFEWVEERWNKNEKLRRIIVRATNPEDNQVEVSILCGDRKRAAKEIIWLMFDRWVQENDFKYLDAHFGINEITSYRSQTYAEIRGQLEDREMKNAAYTALETARREEKKRMGALLVRDKESKRKEAQRAKQISQLEKLKHPTSRQRQELGRYKAGQKVARKYSEKRARKIEQMQERIDQLDKQLQSTDKEVSRLDTLIGKGAVRLCGERKYLMDVIKITARNIFYEMLEPFKKAYDNFRDDHEWFRHLSASGGVMSSVGMDNKRVRCDLVVTADMPKPVRRVIRGILANLNQSAPQLPDGSGRQIELFLGSKSAIELASASR